MDFDQILHKLRGNLTVLQSDVFFIENKSSNSTDHIASAKRTIREMTRVLSQYEVLEKISRNKLHQDQSFIVLQDVIENIIKTNSEPINYTDETIPYVVYADKKYLEMILKELITNALQFGEDISVRISYNKKHFSVHIASKFRPFTAREKINIFKPFSVLEEHRLQSDAGAGLGLPVARAIAEYNGWSVTLSRKSGLNVFSVVF